MSQHLSEQQIAHWNSSGWLALDNVLSNRSRSSLGSWIDAIALPPRSDEQRLHYFEQTGLGRVLCRTERYLEDHADLRNLVSKGPVPEIVEQLLGERAVIYKEKVNYKAAGGAGFNPHQDATAYAYVQTHITCLIAVDPMTTENGCLEFARGKFDHLLPDDGDGCIAPAVEASLDWTPVPVPVGAMVVFSSLAPHRSGPNTTTLPRRALYLTYNRAAEGDLRGAYYRARADRLADASNTAGRARISTIGHFKGRDA